MELSFAKLHGLGNDFVFIDDRDRALKLTDAQAAFDFNDTHDPSIRKIALLND